MQVLMGMMLELLCRKREMCVLGRLGEMADISHHLYIVTVITDKLLPEG